MRSRIALTLLTPWLLAAPVAAESHFGTILFSNAEIDGKLHFTALAPGDTSSAWPAFAGYTQAPVADYTYLYRLDNSSPPGNPSSFCNEHCFTDLDLLTLIDPTNPTSFYLFGYNDGNGGEPASAIDVSTAPNDIDYQFDAAPNYGVVPGNVSAFLFFRSPFAPTDQGGALITNVLGNFASIGSGVVTPVPEPATFALVCAGLVVIGILRRIG